MVKDDECIENLKDDYEKKLQEDFDADKVTHLAVNSTALDKVPHPTEEKYPIQTKAFRALIEKMYWTHLEKNKDYSPANILVTGDVGVIVRTWDKIARIFNLSGLEFPSVKPELEELRKRVIDDANRVQTADMIDEFIEIRECLDKIIEKSAIDFTKIKKKEAANESLDDSWLDLAVYAIIGYLERQNKWGK